MRDLARGSEAVIYLLVIWFFEPAMHDPLSSLSVRFAYVASQLPRLAWYAGHEMVLRRLAAEERRRSGNDIRPPVRSSVQGTKPAAHLCRHACFAAAGYCEC